MPEKPSPPTSAPQPTPYGIGTVHQPGYVPLMNSATFPTAVNAAVYPVNNVASWMALFFGVAALAMTFVSSLPGSATLWVTGAGLAAVLCGLFAIVRHTRRRASILWAPIVGILFGLAAAAVAVLGLNVVNIVSTATGGLVATSSTSVASAPPVSPEPFVFSSNPSLTADGSQVQQIATALNRGYASGNSRLGPGQSWPRSLKFTPTQVLSDSGVVLATVQPGYFFAYKLSADRQSYTFTVSSTDIRESAVYKSAIDRFTFECPATDTSCVPVR